MAATLAALGAEVVELPAIRIEPLIESAEVRDAVESLHAYALVCLTSPNGVRLLFEAMAAAGRDARALAQAQVAAIGPGTARALREHAVIADVVPERSVAEALVESLVASRSRGSRCSWPEPRRPATSCPTRCASGGRRCRRGRLRDRPRGPSAPTP